MELFTRTRLKSRSVRIPNLKIVSRGIWIITLLLAFPGLAVGQGWDRSRYENGDRKSGYLFLGLQTQALQDDDFLNPGMFAVDQGALLWSTKDGPEGLSCASCHNNTYDNMRGVAARLPRYDTLTKGIINLELLINRERVNRLGAEPWAYESDEMLAMTTFLSYQSRGILREVIVTGMAEPFFEQGRQHFFTRRGQLDLSCNQCHDDRDGMMLRGDRMSQGQTTGFPFYRLMWRSMGSTHRMFAWCNEAMRAEPYEYGSPEYLALELYVAWRGRGLPIETPAVRR